MRDEVVGFLVHVWHSCHRLGCVHRPKGVLPLEALLRCLQPTRQHLSEVCQCSRDSYAVLRCAEVHV